MPQATPPPMFEPEENLQARLARAKIESGEVFLALGNAEESVTELGKAYALYPSLAANAYARALLARGEQRERAQNWDAALADYRQALQVAPDGSSLQSEIAAIVRQAEAQQAQRAREKEKPHCSKCGEEVQRGRTLCPHCGQSLKTQESSPQPSLPEQATLHRLKWVLALACTVVGLLAVIGAGIWLVYYQDQQNQRAALERKITQLVSDSVKSLEESKRLERTDKTAARDAAQYALKLAEDARALNPQDPRVSNAYYAAQDALNALSGVSVIFTLPSFATFTDPKSQITRIVAHWPDLFILDRGLQRVYRYVINDVGSNATPTTGDGIILKYGDRIENRTVGELFDIVWLDAGRLAALDRNGAYYQYDPARAAWSARLVNDPAAWSRATLAETYANNLYLVDAPRNQILKYVTPSAGVAWSAAVTYFVPDITPPDLSTAVDLAIDGDAWIARSDGSVSRYNQGRPNDLALAGLDAPISRPSAIVTSEKMSNLYIADAGNQRIVQFDKTTGRFTRQFKPRGQERDAFKALQALAVDEANKRFFFVSEGKAYIATIPQDDSFYSRTPLVATPVPAEQRRGNDNAWMVYVPNGEFPMGASSSDSQASDNEKPQHTVYLDSFWIDKYEVINALYKRCVDAGKCSAPSDRSSYTRSSYYGNSWFDNYPVIYVSWNDASTYCAWAGKRLPTEAEWEKAARGTDGRVYPWGNTFEGAKVNSSDSNPRPGDTIEVGKYPNGASPYGALDMAGNVWEWVADWYGDNYYSISPRNNPKGPSSGPSRVLRGGSGYVNQSYVRASFRGINTPDYRYYSTGFRCAQ
jgi:formylglycine-generating enzyme required for sulfatase activity/tetratricopeptide (TPR) repeat protein